jgi:hypothetical protein
MATANSEKTEKKKSNGKPFEKGKSGNPSGRPKIPQEFKELAKTKSLDALNKIIEIMENPDSDKKDVLRASEMIIDRAWGKATQQIDADVKSEMSITIEGAVKDWAK